MIFPAFNEIFFCPIKHDIIRNPVVDQHGHTFEESGIDEWKQKSNKCPLSIEEQITQLVFNFALKVVIDEWQVRNSLNSPDLSCFEGFKCSLTRTLMKLPVVDNHGHSFDKTALDKWLEEKNNRQCPYNPEETIEFYVTNFMLKEAIESWCETHKINFKADPMPNASDDNNHALIPVGHLIGVASADISDYILKSRVLDLKKKIESQIAIHHLSIEAIMEGLCQYENYLGRKAYSRIEIILMQIKGDLALKGVKSTFGEKIQNLEEENQEMKDEQVILKQANATLQSQCNLLNSDNKKLIKKEKKTTKRVTQLEIKSAKQARDLNRFKCGAVVTIATIAGVAAAAPTGGMSLIGPLAAVGVAASGVGLGFLGIGAEEIINRKVLKQDSWIQEIKQAKTTLALYKNNPQT